MNKVTVSGNIVSKNGIALFFDDGTSQVLPNEGFRTQAILDAVLPSLSRMTPIEIDLDTFSLTKVIEKATNGAVKVEEKLNGDLKITTKAGVIENGNALRQHVEAAATGGGR